jgi:hypothetical protein
MQMDEVTKLRRAWIAAGNARCEHPFLEKEYYLGSATGDCVCTTCGETFWLGNMTIAVSDSLVVNYRQFFFPTETR